MRGSREGGQACLRLKACAFRSDGTYVHRVRAQQSAAAGIATLGPAEPSGLPNGGFPEPPRGAVVRVVRAEHAACGHATRVRLPAQIPAASVRRVVCAGCARAYDAARVIELELVPDPPAQLEPVAVLPEPPGAEPERDPEPEPAPTPEPVPQPEAVPTPRRLRLKRPALRKPKLSRPSGSVKRPSLGALSFKRPTLRTPSFKRPALAAPSFKRPSMPSLPSISKSSLPPLPAWVHDPASRGWRLLSIPLAAAAVIAALMLIQGGPDEESQTPFADTAAPVAPDPSQQEKPGGAAKKPGDASLVRESSFSLALPSGWSARARRAAPPSRLSPPRATPTQPCGSSVTRTSPSPTSRPARWRSSRPSPGAPAWSSVSPPPPPRTRS